MILCNHITQKRLNYGHLNSGGFRFVNSGVQKSNRCKLLIGGTVVIIAGGAAIYSFLPSPIKSNFLDGDRMTNWIPPSRDTIKNQLKESKNKEYDLLIIGGGATGAGCVLEAASRGLKVALIEGNDFSSGTSSKSTKLIHGGIRYLEKAFTQLDIEQYNLVREALYERCTFLKIAPYLSRQLPIVLPLYKWYNVPYSWVGSKFYDLLSGSQRLNSSYYLGKEKTLEEFPTLKSKGLLGSIIYYDGQQDDSRMNIGLILTAIFLGASALNHTKAMSLLKQTINGQERIQGATVRDEMTGEEFNIYAKGVINATGVFSDAIRKMDDETVEEIVAPSSGVHLVLPARYTPPKMGLIDPKTDDGRVIFLLPWLGRVVAGTTDTVCPVTDTPIPSEKDIDYILNEISKQLDPNFGPMRKDVLAAWSGLRPLVKDINVTSSQALVRNHLIHVSKSGLVTIAGGKWTTYRHMGEETIDRAIKEFNLKPIRKSCTHKLLIIGSHKYSNTLAHELVRKYDVEPDIAFHLVSSYGDRAEMILQISEKNSRYINRIISNLPYIEAEIEYVIQNEYATTLIDLISHRTRISFLEVHQTADALPNLVKIMARHFDWSEDRIIQEYNSAQEFLKTMGYDSCIRPTKLDPNVVKLSMDLFKKYDSTNCGLLNHEDVIKLIRQIHLLKYGQIDLETAMEKSGIFLLDRSVKNIDKNMLIRTIEHLSL